MTKRVLRLTPFGARHKMHFNMKTNRTTVFTLILAIVLLLPIIDASAQMYKRRLDVCELLYEEGRYKKAVEYVDDLLKDLAKKEDESSCNATCFASQSQNT